jgi:hypothetical protein
MNNLSGMRTYLVGPMDRVADGGKGWRDMITPPLKYLNINVINPCNKPIKLIKEDETTRSVIDHYKNTGQFDKIKQEYGHIRNADLRCVDVSDFIIARIDMSVHMCGSYEEIVTANRQKKPVLVWCEQGKHNAPNWLFFMLPHEYIFSRMYEILDYLHEVNDSINIDLLDRWIFFTKE